MHPEEAKQLLQVITNFIDPRNSMVNEDASAVDDVNGDGSLVYVGFSKNGSQDGDSNWKILKVTVTGTVTRMKYPTGSKGYVFVWNNRASYTYS